jgi:antitoxin YefM
MDAVTVTHATQNLNQLIEQVIYNVEPTIICNDNGKRALLMSLDEFNSWQETLYLLSNPANAEHLLESIAQAKMGKTQERELIEP